MLMDDDDAGGSPPPSRSSSPPPLLPLFFPSCALSSPLNYPFVANSRSNSSVNTSMIEHLLFVCTASLGAFARQLRCVRAPVCVPTCSMLHAHGYSHPSQPRPLKCGILRHWRHLGKMPTPPCSPPGSPSEAVTSPSPPKRPRIEVSDLMMHNFLDKARY